MGMGTAGMTHFNRSGVDEGNARNLPPAGLQKAAQQHQTPGHQLHKATVADQGGKGFVPVRQHTQGIELLKGTKARPVKGNGNGHHLAQAHTGLTAPFSRHGGELRLLLPMLFKVLAKVVNITEYLGDIQAR